MAIINLLLYPGSLFRRSESAGIQDWGRRSVIEVAKTAVQNFQMDVGAISSRCFLSDVPVIETATTSQGTVINQRTVQEIPLNGRHFAT